MNAKGLKYRIIQNVSLKKPAIFHWRFGENSVPTISSIKSSSKKDTAYYAVSRNSSMKRFNFLIEENYKNQKSLRTSEEKLRLFNQQLSCITQSTSSVIGNEYFNNLVQSLASVFGVRYAFIGIVTGTLIKKIKTLALWDGNKLTKNFVYDLEGTPCEKVTKMEVCYYPQAVQEFFPNDSYLVE